MPEINGDLPTFITSKAATVCSPLPAAGPDQRGPSCGFYAVGHVMQYWYGKMSGTPEKLPVPLPARTHMTGPKPASSTTTARSARDLDAGAGSFTSLRQFGKFQSVTAYGSVFNAENIAKVARLQGVKGHEGQYDGHVITTTDHDDYVGKVKALINAGCPVIVPFDVDDFGDPYVRSGKEAHWGVLFGWYTEATKLFFIHYHWGAYRYAPAFNFAASTQGLTANTFLIMQKAEKIHPRTGKVHEREHFAIRSFADIKKKGWKIKPLADTKANVEFTNPRVLDAPFELDESNDLLRRHGFDPTNLTNAGLKDKLVAVYPASLKSKILAL